MSVGYERDFERELDGDLNRVPVQPLITPLTLSRRVQVDVMRLDCIHSQVSGNKWFKLKPAIQKARATGLPILSFGGAWSNHIHALAFAGAHFSIPTLGIIRGEPEYAENSMLTDARRWGMQLHFVSRAEYRQRQDAVFQASLLERFGDVLIVPEGGSQADAVASVAEIWQHPVFNSHAYDAIFLPVGTGGTLAGVLSAAPEGVEVIGVPVLKADDWLSHDVHALLQQAGAEVRCRWSLDTTAHGGGYARIPREISALMRAIKTTADLELDPVYTAKALWALQRRIVQRQINPHSRILMLHTGGLQGNRGFTEQLELMASEFVGPLAL